MPDDFTGFVADHSIPLSTLDPDAPLDDLEPLADVFGQARVVAIGESSHFVAEYYRLRHRLLRLLAERRGFTVFALESGFSEGLAVDAWVQGGPGDLRGIADESITYRMGQCAPMRMHLAWMREAGLRFAGLDVPGGTGSLLPALGHLAAFARKADPDALETVDRICANAEKYASEHTLLAYRDYAAMEQAARDEMTALLAELGTRFDALEPEYSAYADYRTVRHELRLATLADQALRSYAGRITGQITHPKVAARDRGIAETACWLLDEYGPKTKVLIGAHNSHLQRSPVVTPEFALSAAGHQLAHRLGDDYVSVAVTCVAGQAAGRRANPEAPGGAEVFAADLPPTPESSVEAQVPALHALDLRPARGRFPGPDRIRLIDGFLKTSVVDAHDVVVNLPLATLADQLA